MKLEKAVLAAGCFWGVQELFRALNGVVKTEVGYSGGEADEALYMYVKTGTTEHAEAIAIEFNAEKISYKEILKAFFRMHDPTTKNQQGNDIGRQYRSAIFYLDENQKNTALEVIAEENKTGFFHKPIVTEVVAYETFFSAEEYHQDYLQKHPDGYTCHYWRR